MWNECSCTVVWTLFGIALLWDWKRSILIPIPKKGNIKECANHRTIALISRASKVELKILHARLQHYANQELPDVQSGFRKGRGHRDQIANIRWIIDKIREFQKNIYLYFFNYVKAFDCLDHNKLRRALKQMGIPDTLTSLLRNLQASQGKTVRTSRMEQLISSRSGSGCLLSPCLFNLYAEHIMRNAGLDDLQAGIKIAGETLTTSDM